MKKFYLPLAFSLGLFACGKTQMQVDTKLEQASISVSMKNIDAFAGHWLEVRPQVTNSVVSPISFRLIGTLPNGLRFNPSTGSVYGAPTSDFVEQTFSLEAKAIGSGATTTSFKIRGNKRPSYDDLFGFTGKPLPVTAIPKDMPSTTSTIFDNKYTFTLISPYPSWLSIDRSTGQLKGKPTTDGNYDVDIKFVPTDSNSAGGGILAVKISVTKTDNFTQISSGGSYTCAINAVGEAYCWGYNLVGELGNGTNANKKVPTSVTMPSGVIFTKISSGFSHTCALSDTGEAYCWGGNDEGQLGDGTNVNKKVPTSVTMPSGVIFTKISSGFSHTCALSDAGEAYCWGSNSVGELGNGTNTEYNIPTKVDMPVGVVFIDLTVSAYSSCAVDKLGKAYCWGAGGTLGDGSFDDSLSPIEVSLPVGVSLSQIDGGFAHFCGVSTIGQGFCWGQGAFGELGDGLGMSSTIPVEVTMPTGIHLTQITAGNRHTCAITDLNNAYCWGGNFSGQLGDGTNIDNFVPTEVLMPAGIYFSQVTGGSSHSCALTDDGQAYCWGFNGSGQLGDGTNNDSNLPIFVKK